MQKTSSIISSLLYNINLYYNQSNSLRIKRDLFPALQNKWTHVNPMHQYHILFDAQRRYNIIIYVVLLALKAYRPFRRIAKSNLLKCKSLTHKNGVLRSHMYTHIFRLFSASQFLLHTIIIFSDMRLNSTILMIFNHHLCMLVMIFKRTPIQYH